MTVGVMRVKKQQTTISLPPVLRDALAAYRAEMGESQGSAMRSALRAWAPLQPYLDAVSQPEAPAHGD
jgi:hypothetical protein